MSRREVPQTVRFMNVEQCMTLVRLLNEHAGAIPDGIYLRKSGEVFIDVDDMSYAINVEGTERIIR